MIRKFSVSGFKSLQQAEVDLGAVNVFIGANGSGKSNLLEALGVLGAASFRAVEPEALRYRGVRPGLPTLYKSAFAKRPGHKRDVSRFITLEASNGHGDYRVGLDNPIGETARPWGIDSETLTGDTGDLLTRSPRGFQRAGRRAAHCADPQTRRDFRPTSCRPSSRSIGAEELLSRLC